MHELSLGELRSALDSAELSAAALTSHYLDRIEALNPLLNCVITLCRESAFSEAEAADKRRAGGAKLGALDGIPLLHKDLFCTDGTRTTCGSRMLSEWVAPYDATVVAKLRQAGAIMLGKTNMDEFAMGSSNEHSYFGLVRNPWDLGKVPGGSSGGSAAAIAARLAPLATGTDTGGSIRQPAAFCGVTGIKPTYGRVSRFGMVAFASSLDQGGLMAPRAADLAAALSIIAGADPHDSTCSNEPVDDYSEALAGATAQLPLKGLKVGLVPQHFDTGLDPAIDDAVQRAKKTLLELGAVAEEVNLERSALTVPTYYVIALAECSSNLSRYDGVRFGHRAKDVGSLDELYERSRAEGFGAEVKRRIMLGTYTLSAGYYDAYYKKAQQLRRLITDDFKQAFHQVDVILAPTTPTPPFNLAERLDDPVTMYLGDIYTCGVNLAGLPAINIPVGHNGDGLPLGAQLIGSHFSESTLLRTAHAFQCATHWHQAVPAVASSRAGTAPRG
ncbi:MAG: Asp-tRNA(Asn)/Glu-tRNA(Gln) amidotransferase subunit GatA [Gammaproteobacteria bacterium]|nr:Asp-tRNA(Asn)/Glu-tRNA(Gln) amidotransferase subunit GatA [Gammaproteobacteria bacterium]